MLLKKKVRLILSMALFLVFLWTCFNSLDRLQRKEMSTTTKILKEDKSEWPSVIICLYPKNYLNVSFVEQVKLLPLAKDLLNITMEELGRNKSLDVTFSELLETKQWLVVKKNGDGFKRIYQCFITNIGIARIKRVQVTINLSVPALLRKTAQILIEDRGFFNPFSFNAPGWTIMPFDSEVAITKVMQFTKTIIVDKSSDTNPCEENSNPQIASCMTHYMESIAGCQFQQKKGDNANGNCSEIDFERLVDVVKVIESANLNELSLASGCKRSCQYGKYGLEVTYDKRMTSGESNLTQLFLTSAESDTKVETKVFVYEFSDFAADFGGYIGLLLGASVLSLYDQLVKAYEQIHRRVIKSKKMLLVSAPVPVKLMR